MAPAIPDRWLNYQPIGARVEGTRFIAFKVPLRERVCKTVTEDNRLYDKLLLEKIPDLGVIIDLTNTNRYYDPNFFRNEGVEYKKLMIPGRVTPPPRLVNLFKEFVKKFIQNNLDNDKLIGVHCTHGVNRTGYLICNYMVSEMSVDPPEAITKFAEARGHEIERPNYLQSLHTLNSAEGDEKPKRKEKNHNKKYNKKPERTDRVEENWRIPRDQTIDNKSYGSSHNWRTDNRDRTNTNHTDEARYNWGRDNAAASQDARSSEGARKRKYVDNYRGQSDKPHSSSSAIIHSTPRQLYDGHDSYGTYGDYKRKRDSNNSQHRIYNNNQYGPSNSKYSRSTLNNSNTTKTDNKTNVRIRTDYFSDHPSTSSKRGRRVSHYSQHKQQQ